MASDAAANPQERDDDELEMLVTTMTHSLRARLAQALAARPGSGAAELAEWLDESVRAVRKQLKVLVDIGMVRVEDTEIKRGLAKIYYANHHLPWLTQAHDSRLTPRQRRKVDLEILREIFEDASRAIKEPVYGSRPGRMVASVPGTVDAQAWCELSELQHEMLDRTVEIVAAGNERMRGTGEEPVVLTTGLLLLEMPGATDAGSPDAGEEA